MFQQVEDLVGAGFSLIGLDFMATEVSIYMDAVELEGLSLITVLKIRVLTSKGGGHLVFEVNRESDLE